MYRYDQFDHQIIAERVAQFRGQVERRLSGELTEDEFRILRLQNGLYMQIHAYMLRIAVPYGLLSSEQVRMFAHIARKYDRDYGHFTTRQNIQFNWIKLPDAPDILADLASVEMHAIQTSGNCIRNITCDEFAGVARDEIVDPRPYAEILRQWSTFHPEFGFLPRKFKFSITGASDDRAAIAVHDIGLAVVKNDQGEVGFRVLVGGGLGRTPVIGTEICAFVPWQDVITYVESIVRVYNQYGRRDNMYKSRIKILVKALGIEEFRRQVEADWQFTRGGPCTITQQELDRVSACFTAPPYQTLPDSDLDALQNDNKAFANWLQRNVKSHKVAGYASVVLSLKKTGIAPGDATSAQLDAAAELAERYSFGELRVTHMQNLVLADVKQADLFELWQSAKGLGLATPNIGLLTDIICCPGGDFCTLANARSIPLARAIAECFDDIDFLHDIGEIDLNISGCVNACAHHHIGHIGILGVDKDGEEWYQVSIGGAQGNDSSIGKVIGRSFSFGQIPEVLARLLTVYVENRYDDERFIDTVRRLGFEPFKTYVYATEVENDKELAGIDYELLKVGVPYDMPYYSPRF
ncbi:nitrite/sulfite reductase [Gallionella capsiferriformans]|jgi:sulfite reductase (NADPH) hemoprotein beta-component|uniref:Nitrite and sulphite reductase 4Fe-4S region n=1 Tax=Gallionella capsiferriformans (strain ES-2) TaxID=395494 RepID=D9SHJ0_GALCS|nr:nitrite/sulfite reductase [Gallionella capsiferriformans]ADL55987.1 nitrite and sulphite reductase 4Fe-4S region [Gallionella capsiferriformans ES-2]